MEKTTANASEFVLFLLFDSILNSFAGFQKLFAYSHCFLHSKIDMFMGKSKNKTANSETLSNKITTVQDKEEEDVEMVMEKLGIICSTEEEMMHSSNEISVLFEKKEPSVEEVKEAFEVFGVNSDGLMQGNYKEYYAVWVLYKGRKMEECEKMIRVFDENRDGLIDFNEFVKLMERSFVIN